MHRQEVSPAWITSSPMLVIDTQVRCHGITDSTAGEIYFCPVYKVLWTLLTYSTQPVWSSFRWKASRCTNSCGAAVIPAQLALLSDWSRLATGVCKDL